MAERIDDPSCVVSASAEDVAAFLRFKQEQREREALLRHEWELLSWAPVPDEPDPAEPLWRRRQGQDWFNECRPDPWWQEDGRTDEDSARYQAEDRERAAHFAEARMRVVTVVSEGPPPWMRSWQAFTDMEEVPMMFGPVRHRC